MSMPMDVGQFSSLAWLFDGGVNKALSMYWGGGKSVFLCC